MICTETMVEPSAWPDKPAAESVPSVFISYGGLAAGKRAIGLVKRLEKSAPHLEFQLSLWSFKVLSEGSGLDQATREAAQADLLIIATDEVAPLPVAVGWWLESVIRQKEGTAAAVIALLGSEENPDRDGSFRLETLRSAVRRAELSFFTPRSDPATRTLISHLLQMH